MDLLNGFINELKHMKTLNNLKLKKNVKISYYKKKSILFAKRVSLKIF